jgi:SPFH domain / Band 7 family
MAAWSAIQHVGTGLSLCAFAIAAALLAYRARLQQRAEVIKSAPQKERLAAIAATAEFFNVDVSGLTEAHQQEVVLAQIKLRARRESLFAGVALAIAALLAILAFVTITGSQRSDQRSVALKDGTHAQVQIGWSYHIEQSDLSSVAQRWGTPDKLLPLLDGLTGSASSAVLEQQPSLDYVRKNRTELESAIERKLRPSFRKYGVTLDGVSLGEIVCTNCK